MKPGLLGCLLLLLVTNTWAHRLDEYLQATRIAVATNRVDLSMELTPGVAVADQVLAVIDKNGDGRVSTDEAAGYARRVLKDIQVALDQKGLALTVVETSFPTRQEMKAGIGILRIKTTASFELLSPGNHTLSITNAHLPAISVYLVNALTPKDRAIKITKQTRDELQKNYHLEFSAGPQTPSR